MNQPAAVVLEENVPFSQSKLWQAQREFYDKKGIDAWTSDVPFYITSNPFIANHYAQIVIRFIQDWCRKYPDAKKHPFYIVELGTGSGQFSFYVMKKIFELRAQLNLEAVTIQYIMSDFTKKNLEFWKQHVALQSFSKKKWLDFSVFDLENDTCITLINSKIVLQSGTVHNPLIAVANYIFDTLITDIFTVQKNKLHESLVKLKTLKRNVKQNKPVHWEKVKINFKSNEILETYYHNELDNILFEYQKTLEDSHFPFPIGSLRCIQHLNHISQNKLLLLSSDKGYTTISELDNLDYPYIDFHGSFSVMVNFHTIGQYFKMHGGDYCHEICHDSITSTVFVSGMKWDDFPETKLALQQVITGFSASDYFSFYEHFEKIAQREKLNVLVSFLCLSQWDPFIFDIMVSRLIELLPNSEESTVAFLVKNIPQVADHFYFLPDCEDIFFSIGLLLYELDLFSEALNYYKKSEKYFGVGFESLMNSGLCYLYLNRYKSALKYFTKAHKLKPRSKQIKTLIDEMRQKVSTL